MTNRTLLLATALMTLSVSGCSSTPQEQFEKKQASVDAKQSKAVEQKIDSIPDWFLNYDPSSADGLYAVATSVSDEIQNALDDARTLALADIASKNALKFSSQKSLSQKKDGGKNTSNTSALITDEFVNKADLSGYKIVKREVKAEGKFIRAYVMVFFPNVKQSDVDVSALKQDHKQLLERLEKENGTDKTVKVLPLSDDKQVVKSESI
jgi:hypothetical protein